MSSFIEDKIAWFKDTGKEYGYRKCSLREEIRRQQGIVASYADIVDPNPQDLKHAQDYLAALLQTKTELEEEATLRHINLTENDEIYWDVYRSVLEEHANKQPLPVDLQSHYLEFRHRYFCDSTPELSNDFIVEFIRLPFDVAGISYLEEDAVKLGVKPGIRINEKLKNFPAEAKVALLHEMIHAKGVRKHQEDFKLVVVDIFEKGAYLDPLLI